MGDTNGRRLAVFAVPESKDGEKRFWPRIGVAFANRDGSINLLLDALPLGTNKLQIREQKEAESPRNGPGAPRRDLAVGEVRS